MRTSSVLIAAAAAGALCATSSVTAHGFYKQDIPNGDNVVDSDGVAWPGVGHDLRAGFGSRNPFGKDFAAQGHTWTNVLCKLDSDGDGISNGMELGDPHCKWKKGDTPERVTDITHPGIPNGSSGGGGGGGGTLTGAPRWVEAHGFTMTIAWMLVIPLAISFPVLFKNRTDTKINWFSYHRALVGTGLGMVFVAVTIAIFNTPSSHFADNHGKLGLATVIVAFFQAVSGALRPHKGEEHTLRARAIWEPVHWWTGRSVVVLAAAAVYTGYADNLSVYTKSATAVGIDMVGVTAVWGVAYVVYKLVLSPNKSNGGNETDALLDVATATTDVPYVPLGGDEEEGTNASANPE